MAVHAPTQPINEYLRDARGTRSRMDIARADGPDPSLIARIESGERLPTIPVLKRLCEVYGLDFEDAVERLNRTRIERDLASVA